MTTETTVAPATVSVVWTPEPGAEVIYAPTGSLFPGSRGRRAYWYVGRWQRSASAA